MLTKTLSIAALAALAVPALCAEGETAFQRDLVKQYAQGLIQEKGTAAFAEIVAFCNERMATAEPQLRLDYVLVKANALMLSAETKEDLQKACDSLEADLQSVDRTKEERADLIAECERALKAWRGQADQVLRAAAHTRGVIEAARHPKQ